MIVANTINDLVGNTPILQLNRLFKKSSCSIFAKLEMQNPTSLKDRAVLGMVTDAIEAGKILPGTEVVEATSGNTGIALAALAPALGFKARLYMSELCSIERQKIMAAFGATVVLTPAAEHTRGARERALDYIARNLSSTYFLNQHSNPANGDFHYKSTGPEIWEQLNGRVDAIVLGLGTCGTFEGTSKYLKENNPDVKVFGVEPFASPVYSGGVAGTHHITGIGPGFITENFKRGAERLDEIILVEDAKAFEWARKIAQTEGILVGPSSGANLFAVDQIIHRPEFIGKRIACILCDTGERYLSEDGFVDVSSIIKT